MNIRTLVRQWNKQQEKEDREELKVSEQAVLRWYRRELAARNERLLPSVRVYFREQANRDCERIPDEFLAWLAEPDQFACLAEEAQELIDGDYGNYPS